MLTPHFGKPPTPTSIRDVAPAGPPPALPVALLLAAVGGLQAHLLRQVIVPNLVHAVRGGKGEYRGRVSIALVAV